LQSNLDFAKRFHFNLTSRYVTLMNSFNDMLREIQNRDVALQKAHDELEQRVTERTRELVSANRELEAFSYSVSHDLRGPLDALNGYSYILLKNHASKLDATGKESLQNIRAAARRMSDLIDDLLNLSRLSTSSMHREKVDLTVFARGIMEELCRNAPERKVEFIAPPSAEAYADARLLRIVLDNLLRNAWKYTAHHDAARIEFGQEISDGRVYISSGIMAAVSINVPPIDCFNLSSVFIQLRNFPAMGLGLPRCGELFKGTAAKCGPKVKSKRVRRFTSLWNRGAAALRFDGLVFGT
jgi:signal transduction histidine kinase